MAVQKSMKNMSIITFNCWKKLIFLHLKQKLSSPLKIFFTIVCCIILALWKDCIGWPKFPRLTKVVKLILVIPHSNAEEESVFLLVRKKKTCFRPNLDLDESLASVITCKRAMKGESVTKFSNSDDIISTAKQATTKYNKQHSEKE